MIIRKPFKFLIKHFKIINVILLLLMGFVCYKSGMLVEVLLVIGMLQKR